MLVENGGFLNSNAYTQCFVKSRILPCSVPFLINMKKNKKNKSSSGFGWRMVACVGKYWVSTFNPEHYIICCYDLCLVKEIKKRSQKNTHTTVLHTY